MLGDTVTPDSVINYTLESQDDPHGFIVGLLVNIQSNTVMSFSPTTCTVS